MTEYIDLEIGLHRHDIDSYTLEVRSCRSDDDSSLIVERGGPPLVIDRQQLHQLQDDKLEYGTYLSNVLFEHPLVRAQFIRADTTAQELGVQLRLRLLIGPSAARLQHLHWETLVHPTSNTSLLTSENILFSRFVSSQDLSHSRMHSNSTTRALVVIANPHDLAISYEIAGRRFHPIDVPGEIARIQAGLGPIETQILASGGIATLNKMMEHLRDGYDILYLVCHGAIIDDEPWLWMEDSTGGVARIAGEQLVTRLCELQQRPKLVVLAACQTAGGGELRTDDVGALAAIGPSLAQHCIPAVIAMQGNITAATVAQFMPTFFHELQQHGVIDQAMAAARGAVRERDDSWMPVLFMRLKNGRLWYMPGSAKDPARFERWPKLLSNITQKHCTVILGPDLLEAVMGSSRQIAERWAETYKFPMAPYHRDALPLVAQYLTINQDARFPYDTALPQYVFQELIKRHDNLLDGNQPSSAPDELLKLLAAVGARRRDRNPMEPHAVLAQLPLPIYITTNPDNLLAEALTAAGKDPVVEICPWNDDTTEISSIFDTEPGYQPSLERPLVYHLFGHLSIPPSLVLTEDDYFDFLIGMTTNKRLIPASVRMALTNSALLFLGFQLDDWNFRVLFRSLMKQQGSERRRNYTHIAAQIDPDASRILEPERARKYLESYFQAAFISVYWVSTEDFIRELVDHWNTGQSLYPPIGRDGGRL